MKSYYKNVKIPSTCGYRYAWIDNADSIEDAVHLRRPDGTELISANIKKPDVRCFLDAGIWASITKEEAKEIDEAAETSYEVYAATFNEGHFDSEPLMLEQAWAETSVDMRRVTINVLQHQQRVMRNAAGAKTQSTRDVPVSEVDAW